ncbi:MAG: MFS transporter [Rhodobacteraceae bacterium]|nr:MFS transporter [Paracoccaceae bacterium]
MAVSARRRIWGWWFFDWASQPYSTLLLTFIFAPYFAEVARAHYGAVGAGIDPAAAAQATWATGQTVAGVAIALAAPVLGAIADGSGRRMAWIWLFSAFYVAGAAGLWWLAPDAPALTQALVFFGIGLVGMELATIFTNALMPDLATLEGMGRLSGYGFAFGYLGGIVALVIFLAFFAENSATGRTLIGIEPVLGLDAARREGTRAVGPFVALWYVLFMVPFFLWVREAPARGPARGILRSLAALGALLAALGRRRSLAAYLGASMLYRDALNALYAFGGIYASGVLGWSVTRIGAFGIAGAISAAVFSWIGGRADSARGPKPVIRTSMAVLVAVCLVIAGMSREAFWGIPFAPGSPAPDIIFYACGCLIGAAGGTLQAASRTMMVFHAAPGRATEAFGLYALSGKATAFVAPFLIAVATAASGSQRIGIALPLISLFLAGMLLLRWVDPYGERA